MYQVIYIDIDEEITSIVERLRKARTPEVFFVVPKRALLIQSVVSLKLLKREADKIKKRISIVTQDPHEKKLIETAGITVRPTLEGMEVDKEVKEEMVPKLDPKKEDIKKEPVVPKKIEEPKKARVMGTKGFFEKEDEKIDKDGGVSMDGFVGKSPQVERNISKDDMFYFKEKGSDEENLKRTIESNKKGLGYFRKDTSSFNKELDQEKEKALESYFSEEDIKKKEIKKEAEKEDKKKQKDNLHVPVSGRLKKVWVSFIVVCLFAIGGAGAYILVPSAKISLILKGKVIKSALEIKADSGISGVNYEEMVIPSRVLEKEEVVKSNFESTGSSASSTQKARGKITIYNEFGPDPQPLVATTRFLSSDGKLFRLIKGVTVPGTTQVAGKTEPGAIEADVIADEPGEDYNIGPSDFTIPGFEGSSKYDKFYAKSTENMTGGGSQGNEVSVVTETDIANAKNETEKRAKEKIRKSLEMDFFENEILLEDAFEIEILDSFSSVRAEEISGDFEYQVRAKIKAFVFSEKDIKSIFEKRFREENGMVGGEERIEIMVDYAKSTLDFENKNMMLKANGEVTQFVSIDTENFRTELAGKNEDQIREVLKNYPEIREMDISFWPEFMSKRLPYYKGRIEVEIKTSE